MTKQLLPNSLSVVTQQLRMSATMPNVFLRSTLATPHRRNGPATSLRTCPDE